MRRIYGGIFTGVLALVAAITVQSAANASAPATVSKAIVDVGNDTLAFPPSFMGHPVAYWLAIFGQLVIFSFATLILTVSFSSLDREKKEKWGDEVLRGIANNYRVRRIWIMLSVWCGVLPNLLIYLTWGEISTESMITLMTVDKLLKFFAVVPFTIYVYKMAKQMQETKDLDELMDGLGTIPSDRVMSYTIKPSDQQRVVVIVFILATLVTFAKATGHA